MLKLIAILIKSAIFVVLSVARPESLISAQTATPEPTSLIQHAFTAIAWSPNGDFLAYAGDYGICGETPTPVFIVDAVTGVHVITLLAGYCATRAFDWSPDGSKLAATSGDSLGFRVWDVSSGQVVAEAQRGGQGEVSIRWHPTLDQLLVSSVGGSTAIFDALTGEVITLLNIGGTYIDWNPDGTFVVVSSIYVQAPPSLYIVDSILGDTHLLLNGLTALGIAVDWSPDGRKIVAAGVDGTVVVWDATNGQLLTSFQVVNVYNLQWSPDSSRIAFASGDGFAQIWDVEAEQIIETFDYTGSVSALDWSPDGTKIAYGGAGDSDAPPELVIVDAPVLVPTLTPTATP